ncbi:glycosyltransferase [Paraburkholderia acidisoli]|uniref:Glycosyltransferase n=1 Tax=Paraburkholderia acidisoli TaxID=2571748 RepID=A0A7Z2JE88_9BURK|nr:glycosyltransferase [Paraburkholderia acidisoli]QGZ60698.1 glycosyltransferase [Paraburkholderia acidisoli]
MVNRKLHGVVVLYNPGVEVIDAIESYRQCLGHLYIIDNSERRNEQVFSRLSLLPQSTYIGEYENKGVALALNIGAREAIKNGAQWLLTMDQDSTFRAAELEKFLDAFEALRSRHDEIGILSPSHNDKGVKGLEVRPVVMTSGNILNLHAFTCVSGFEEKLFIDAVDYDFCLRLKNSKFTVFQINDVMLDHKLGTTKEISFIGFRRSISVHSPLRRYYMTRNALYYWRKHFWKHPIFVVSEIMKFSKNFIEIMLFSENRRADFGYMIRGIIDYYRGNFGQFKN